MKLNEIQPAPGAIKKRKRLGRGPASGRGGTAGKGHKGEQARSGSPKRKSFEGGQMPLTRRIPKFGFTNFNRVEYQVINVSLLGDRYKDGDTVTTETLVEHGLLSKRFVPVKVLGNGNLTKKLNVKVDAISKSAKEKIESAGGSITIEMLNPRQKRARVLGQESQDSE